MAKDKGKTVNIVKGNARVGMQVGGSPRCPHTGATDCGVCEGTRRMEARGIVVEKSRF